jgi:predicted glycosyltransferase
VLVDHEPVGYDGELREALSALKEQRPASRFVYLMRDVDDDPEFIRNRWTKQQAYEALDDLYDCIAVYGAPAIFDPAETYALSPTARAKLHYCGYIVRDRPEIDARSVRERFGIPVGAPLVVATVGSGSDGYPVLEAVLAALPLLRTRCPELYAIAATGPFMPPAQRDSLACRAGPQDRVLAEATVPELLVAADAAIGMGGYNSVFEALALARPLVIIPRTPRSRQKMEQLLRARALSRLGLARCVAPDELASERVAEALAGALAEDRAALAARIARSIPSFDGAASLVDLLSPWLTPKTF